MGCGWSLMKKNYLLFSLTSIEYKGDSKVVGVGVLGNVIISSQFDNTIYQFKQKFEKAKQASAQPNGNQTVATELTNDLEKIDNASNEDTQLFELSLSKDLSFKLTPSDQIIFRNKYYSATRNISISGPVKSSGSFILTRELTLNKLIDLAGGFLDNANKEGIYIKRQIELEDVKLESLENSKISNFNTIILSVDFLKAKNIYLKENDQVIIGEKDNSITITGAVQAKPPIVLIEKRT